MKHEGKAARAGLRMILLSLGGLVGILFIGLLARMIGSFLGIIATVLFVLWGGFAVFVFNFFRDPDAAVPSDPKVIVSPAHGTVDVIDEVDEPVFMGGRCKRISIFLSVVDVHVQQSPVSGRVALVRHTPGRFINAMKSDCALYNENVLVGIDSSECRGEKIGVRLIAGLIARRIIPWIAEGDSTSRGERISLIQFGSRADLYLPLTVNVKAVLGQKVQGGESILAVRG